MSSDEGSRFPNSTQIVFPNDPLRFNCGPPPPQHSGSPPIGGFIDDRPFSVDRGATSGDRFFSHPMYGGGDAMDRREPPENNNWNGSGSAASFSGDGSEDIDGDDDDDDEEEDDGEVGNFMDGGNKSNATTNNKNNNNSNNNSSGSVTVQSGGDKTGNDNQKQNYHSSFGSGREVIIKDGTLVHSVESARAAPNDNHQLGRIDNYQNVVAIAENDGDLYYSRFVQGAEGTVSVQKNAVMENGTGCSVKKDAAYPSESETLRRILSDPVTGLLMDDAMILPCGHSFGSGGIQHVVRMKACFTCSQSVSEGQISPNLSLRAAVQAFRREDESQYYRSSKRRRDRFDQDKCGYADPSLVELPRGRGVQFPFSVADRVIIKGNKRTPPRFVGREAVVTTQCLNGWYVVKTLDNAESVKLQYRSLAKVADPLTKPISMTTSSWL